MVMHVEARELYVCLIGPENAERLNERALGSDRNEQAFAMLRAHFGEYRPDQKFMAGAIRNICLWGQDKAMTDDGEGFQHGRSAQA